MWQHTCRDGRTLTPAGMFSVKLSLPEDTTRPSLVGSR